MELVCVTRFGQRSLNLTKESPISWNTPALSCCPSLCSTCNMNPMNFCCTWAERMPERVTRRGGWLVLYVYRRILLALPMYSSAGMYFSGFPCILIRNRPSAGDFVAPAPSGTRSHFMAYPLVFSHNHSTAIKQTPNHRQVCFISRLV